MYARNHPFPIPFRKFNNLWPGALRTRYVTMVATAKIASVHTQKVFLAFIHSPCCPQGSDLVFGTKVEHR